MWMNLMMVLKKQVNEHREERIPLVSSCQLRVYVFLMYSSSTQLKILFSLP